MSISAHFIAIERVHQRLLTLTATLDTAGIRYAVVGGNAVASWVARVDPGATRATNDVNLLVCRADVPQITSVITSLGYTREDLRDLILFLDPHEPSRRSGVHLVWAAEKIRPSYSVPSPGVEESVRDAEGYWVLDLPALLRMKLTSFRPIDQVHVADMLAVGLIDDRARAALPAELLTRLHEIESRDHG